MSVVMMTHIHLHKIQENQDLKGFLKPTNVALNTARCGSMALSVKDPLAHYIVLLECSTLYKAHMCKMSPKTTCVRRPSLI